ncbi:MAG: 2-dehydro-3-deoxyphosphooctonate aldolase [Cytophagaceae bacterium]|nr:2-dehydro-3-deoxyphosphooctonate aldolase [Cytophagaceae bacterium]|tara:strand:- start:700 stop:1050 length:351 start_codon:yes stop_codon:yes gene_type:complete
MNPAENYIISKPEPWRSILMELRDITRHAVPEVTESFKWALPFYTLNGKMFCYLNFRKKFVEISFLYAHRMTHLSDYLIAGEGRKIVRSLRYTSLEDIDYDVLIQVLLAQKENISR